MTRKEYARAHYLANKEKYVEKARQWRLANPERYKANQDRWRAENPDTLREQRRSAGRKWYGKNRLDKIEYTKEWARQNRDKRCHVQKMRQARLRGASGKATMKQVDDRFAYYGNQCAYCGGSADTIDHVIPVSRGGSNLPANLRPACWTCNTSKGDRPLGVFLRNRRENT